MLYYEPAALVLILIHVQYDVELSYILLFTLPFPTTPSPQVRILDSVDEEDSDFDDITMVQMNLDQSTVRVDFTKYGMWSLCAVNAAVVVIVSCSLAMT